MQLYHITPNQAPHLIKAISYAFYLTTTDESKTMTNREVLSLHDIKDGLSEWLDAMESQANDIHT